MGTEAVVVSLVGAITAGGTAVWLFMQRLLKNKDELLAASKAEKDQLRKDIDGLKDERLQQALAELEALKKAQHKEGP